MFGVASLAVAQRLPQLEGLFLFDIGEKQILRVRDPHLAEAVAIGQIGDQLHLRIGGIARRDIGLLQRHVHNAVAGHLVLARVVAVPGAKRRIPAGCGIGIPQAAIGRGIEEAAHARDLRLGDAQRPCP